MKTLNQISGMPQISVAFSGWQKKITLVVITQQQINGFIKDTESTVTFSGTIQPLSEKQLNLKPEGERAWMWYQIHAIAGQLNLDTNSKIIYDGNRYKVMAIRDYSLNNYIEYHVVRDYQQGATS